LKKYCQNHCLSRRLNIAFPGRGAARSGAPLIRDRHKLGIGVRDDPGSAAHHSAPLRAALRPGKARYTRVNSE
jgi:hypothetical protein